MPDLVVCSHRGPLQHRRVRGRVVAGRGGGGLIGAVRPLMESSGGTWIAAALTPADREVAARNPAGSETGGFRLRLLDLPEDVHALHYDLMSNEYLWFAFHYLFDTPNSPVFDTRFARAWDAYRQVGAIYARAVAEAAPCAAVWVHDYHLMTLGHELRALGEPSAPLLYFHHTPWPEPDYLSIFPAPVAGELVRGLLSYDVVAFHSRRWASAFVRCCEAMVPGAQVDAGGVTFQGRRTAVLVAPAPLDAPSVLEASKSPAVQSWTERLEAERDGRRVLARVDRIDLSKNSLRGFLAFEALLERRPELASSVWFLAMQYPSRLKVSSYRRYLNACMKVVRRINDRHAGAGPGGEGPVGWYFQDDFERSLAGMRIYDAMLVNPVFDGLNLVAKEGPVVNERNGTLILSTNAGVVEEIGEAAIRVNPFDVTGTCDAIEQALEMTPQDRANTATKLRALATATTPQQWGACQLKAAGVGS
ncbi:MAG TPA: trehalose-6-phosphate synthase [Actinomycetota bacterium]|nr:trehalose-6-phosphate synthase [Actinomycetota bacterium]